MIGEPTALAATDSVAHVLCNGDANGAISLIPSGGTPNYSILWTNGDTTWALSGLTAGTYGYTITDAYACTWSDSIVVLEPNAIALTTVVTDETAPNNGAVDLTVNGGTAGYTFLWSNGATTEDLSGLAAGTYSVTVTDVNGCTDTVSVTVALLIGIDGDLSADITVSPNPNQGLFKVQVAGITGAYSIEVTDVVGRRVAFVETASEVAEMQVNAENGVYLVTVKNNDTAKTVRVVIAR
jgi:hypothetical protein